MKKILFGALLGMFAVAGVAVLPNVASATGDAWENPQPDTNMLSDSDQKLTGSSLLDAAKKTINWIMAMLATVALCICLYGGFKMVTSAGDEKKYGDGLKVLKYAAIGLAIIGISWMIVGVIFWFVGAMGGSENSTIPQGSSS